MFDKQALRHVLARSAIFFIFKMAEQRTCTKFCVKYEIKCSEVIQMLEKGFGYVKTKHL